MTWRSQYYNMPWSWSGILHANHVLSGIVINLGECSCTHTLSISCEVASASKGSHNRVESCTQDMYKHRAIVMMNGVLIASRLFL
jgi:hypothetical protein